MDRKVMKFEKGNHVVIVSNSVCYAPAELIGHEGVIVELLNGRVSQSPIIEYKKKYEVIFPGQPATLSGRWIFDERELIDA